MNIRALIDKLIMAKRQGRRFDGDNAQVVEWLFKADPTVDGRGATVMKVTWFLADIGRYKKASLLYHELTGRL